MLTRMGWSLTGAGCLALTGSASAELIGVTFDNLGDIGAGVNSYAIYRIAETIRVILFMTLSIVFFNFYPVTAIMIVFLALLNDGAILSISYDNVRYSNAPEAWDMRLVLSVATVLGAIGVVESFGLFVLAERVFDLDRDTIQTLIYLKLSVAGHLTVFQGVSMLPQRVKCAVLPWHALKAALEGQDETSTEGEHEVFKV